MKQPDFEDAVSSLVDMIEMEVLDTIDFYRESNNLNLSEQQQIEWTETVYEMIRQEIKRITWATKRDTMVATLTVLIMVIIASLFFFLVDLLLSNIVELILSLGN